MTAAAQALWQRLQAALPALAFFGGFLWDALTLGRNVQALDLWILAAYLAGAALLLLWLSRRAQKETGPVDENGLPPSKEAPASALSQAKNWLIQDGPYFALQFFFGGLFSALFIFYFKSSSHFTAYFAALVLATLLVANEFLENHYGRFTLTWTLFGVCFMLLLNFAIPHVLGSLHWLLFYVSTLLGALGTHGLRRIAAGRPGRIGPTWAAALILAAANFADIIPPVPLVQRNLVMGQNLEKAAGLYRLEVEAAPWWVFWRSQAHDLHVSPGQRLYCMTSIFAPKGLHTTLYHRWLRRDPKKGWVTVSRIGFNLSGGRQGGFRGYTYKQSLAEGDWKIKVETEDERTVASHRFQIHFSPQRDSLNLRIWDL